jgi:hypothetical protein
MLRMLICAFAATSLCWAQNPSEDMSKDHRNPGGEIFLKGLAKYHAIPHLENIYGASGQSLISDLRPLRSLLFEKCGVKSENRESEKPLRDFSGWINMAVRESDRSRTMYGATIRIVILKSFDATEYHAAFYLSNLNVEFDRGSLSGGVVGDWAASRGKDDDRNCIIYFLRKNAFVMVSYDAPFEMSKTERGKVMHTERDSTIQSRCEQLARQIDEQIRLLPGQDAK